MDAATVIISLTPADIERFKRFVGNQKQFSWSGLAVFVIAVVLIGGSFFSDRLAPPRQLHRHEAPPTPWTTLIPVGLCIGVYFYLQWRSSRVDSKKHSPHLFRPQSYSVREDGLFCENERGQILNYWSSVARFVETEEDFFVMLTKYNGHALPKRCFPNREAVAIFGN